MDKSHFLHIAQMRTQKFKILKKAIIIVVILGSGLTILMMQFLETIQNEKIQLLLILCGFIVMFMMIAVVSVWGLLLSICPHCHEFSSAKQSINVSINLGGLELGNSSGKQLNPDFCGKCGKPLSEKAVKQFFRQPETLF